MLDIVRLTLIVLSGLAISKRENVESHLQDEKREVYLRYLEVNVL